jgi:hypothetical protein
VHAVRSCLCSAAENMEHPRPSADLLDSVSLAPALPHQVRPCIYAAVNYSVNILYMNVAAGLLNM